MIGILDSQVIEKFKEFQQKTGKCVDINIEEVQFEKKLLKELHQKEKVKTQKNSTADKFIEIGDIDRKTKKYDISSKVKYNLPEKGKHAPKGTILVSRVRPLLGGYTIIDGDDYTFTSGDLNPIVLPENVDVNYVFKIICSPKFELFLKNNQNTSGQKPTITDKLYNFDIAIPLKQDKYESLDIQRAIVEFLEYSFDNLERIKSNIDKRYEIVSKMRKSLILSTFKKTAIKNRFNKYAEENNINFEITDIEFNIKRIHSKNDDEVVCKKRMGFSPEKDKNDNINWFRVEDLNANDGLYINAPDTILKTTMKKIKDKNGENSSKNASIKKGDILVSFLATPGIVKIYNSNEIAYCNQAIDILTVNEGFDNRYIAYNCMFEYPKYGREQTMGKNLNDEDKEKIKIFTPKDLDNYTSFEIQQILADFIEHVDNQIEDKYIKKYTRGYEVVELLRETYLKRTFNKIVWS